MAPPCAVEKQGAWWVHGGLAHASVVARLCRAVARRAWTSCPAPYACGARGARSSAPRPGTAGSPRRGPWRGEGTRRSGLGVCVPLLCRLALARPACSVAGPRRVAVVWLRTVPAWSVAGVACCGGPSVVVSSWLCLVVLFPASAGVSRCGASLARVEAVAWGVGRKGARSAVGGAAGAQASAGRHRTGFPGAPPAAPGGVVVRSPVWRVGLSSCPVCVP